MRIKPPPPGCLEKTQAAEYLGISVATLNRLMRDHKLRVMRPSMRRVLFRTVDLDVYLSKTASLLRP